MSDELRLADMVGRIYDAALGQEDWGAVLERLADMVGGDSSVVLNRAGRPTQPDPAIRVRADPAYIPLYNTYYHKTSPILPALQAESVFVDFELIPESTLMRTEYRSDFAMPQGRRSGLYWVDFDRASPTTVLTIWRSRRRPDWGEDDVRMLRHIAPHFRRARRLEDHIQCIPGQWAPPRALGSGATLTPREVDCLACIARGASSKLAARQLDLSVHTVSKYVESAMRKLKASSRSEAVAKALSHGLLPSAHHD
jgi:DNA-binding CsgD family transcriptional regulator